ncbi:MAG TPA: PAS domain S-box protein [Silvibacterium sp.]|nr:PAS domain S-box protein [Silvibacterium sp.]
MNSEIEISAALELFEAAPCAFLFTSVDGTITRVNETILQWTGYRRAELEERRKFQDLLTRPSAIFYETHFFPLLQMQGFIREITVDLVCADGSTLPVLVNSKLHRALSGEPAMVLTSIFDIRERRSYERELLHERRRSEQWAFITENATDAIFSVDAELKLTSWNRSAECLFGYKAAEALGRSVRDLIIPSVTLDAFDRDVAKLHTGQYVQRELVVRNKQNSLIDTSVSITPRIDPVDEYAGFSAIVRDVRARKKSEKAQQVVRDLELINRLAHEINNPLQAAVNCMEILRQAEINPYIEIVQENLDRIAQVILQLLSVTRGPAK